MLALLHRYGIASPASADLSRAVVMSFSAAACGGSGAPRRYCRRSCSAKRRATSGAARRPRSVRPRSALPSRRYGSTRSWWTGRQPKAGPCTAGPSTTTRSPVLPRNRSRVGRDQPSRPYQGLATARADRRRTRLAVLRARRALTASSRHRRVGFQRGEQAARGVVVPDHDRSESLPVNSPMGTVVAASAMQRPAQSDEVPNVGAFVDGDRAEAGRDRPPPQRVEPHGGTGGPVQQGGHEPRWLTIRSSRRAGWPGYGHSPARCGRRAFGSLREGRCPPTGRWRPSGHIVTPPSASTISAKPSKPISA